MNNILIGMGGTGAKCIESVVHLLAAGMVNGDSRVFLVDQDDTNTCTLRAHETAVSYADIRGRLATGKSNGRGSGPLSSKLHVHEHVLRPVPDINATLETAFRVSELPDPDGANDDDGWLMRALFTETERRQDMGNGFKARPAVGNAAYLKAAQDEIELWRELIGAIGSDARSTASEGPIRIMLLGSIFGGTGAAGLPTLAQKIRSHLHEAGIRDARLGAVVMLPYYRIEGDSHFGPVSLDQIRLALEYYNRLCFEQWDEKLLDSLYLVGLDRMIAVPDDEHGGGPMQDNPPALPELIAALATCHFLHDDSVPPGRAWYCTREQQGSVGLEDLPSAGNGASNRDTNAQLVSFLRFLFAYLHAYDPIVADRARTDLVHSPCLRRYLDPGDIRSTDGQALFDSLRAYSERALWWYGCLDVVGSSDANLRVELFNGRTFAELNGAASGPTLRFPQAREPGGKVRARELSSLKGAFTDMWPESGARDLGAVLARLSEGPAKPPTERGYRGFLDALYDACAVSRDGELAAR